MAIIPRPDDIDCGKIDRRTDREREKEKTDFNRSTLSGCLRVPYNEALSRFQFVSESSSKQSAVTRTTLVKKGEGEGKGKGGERFECPLICRRFIENSSNLKLHGWDDRFIFRKTGSNERVETGDIGEGVVDLIAKNTSISGFTFASFTSLFFFFFFFFLGRL